MWFLTLNLEILIPKFFLAELISITISIGSYRSKTVKLQIRSGLTAFSQETEIIPSKKNVLMELLLPFLRDNIGIT